MCLNKCRKIEAAGILCGDRPWTFCDSEAVSFWYSSLDAEERQIFFPRGRSGNHESTIVRAIS